MKNKNPFLKELRGMTLDEVRDTKLLFILAQDFETAAYVREKERRMTGYKPSKEQTEVRPTLNAYALIFEMKQVLEAMRHYKII